MHAMIELKWDPFKGAIGYTVGYSTPSGAHVPLTQVDGPLSCLVNVRLESRQLYRFWVQAFDGAGNTADRIVIQNVYQE